MLYVCGGGGVREGTLPLALLSAGFQPLPPLPRIKFGPSGDDSWVGGLVYILGPCGSLQWPLLWSREFLLLPPQPPQMFSVRGLRLYFLTLQPWVVQSVSLPSVSPSLSAWECGTAQVGLPSPQAATLPRVLSTHLPVFAPPTGLDECFFFISLDVGLPYSSIFWQFWLFFVFKFVVGPFFGCARRHSVSTYASILARSPMSLVSSINVSIFHITWLDI